jgi:hypothetical protein
MCDSFNDVGCPITLSTIGNPDATFVSGVVNDDLQFRGIDAINNITLQVAPTTITITSTPGTPVADVSMTGLFDEIEFVSLPVPTAEQNFTLLSTYSNTGIFAGQNLTIPTLGYYKVCFSPTIANYNSLPLVPNQISYRMRDSGLNIYAEFYEQFIGNDEQTTTFCQIMYLPAGVYTFSVQISNFPSGIGSTITFPSTISVKLVGF